MFGATAPKRLTSIFRLGYKFNPPEQVERHLDSLVRQANDLIKKVFLEQTNYLHHLTTDERQDSIYRRAHYDGSSYGYFKHMAIPVGLSWETQKEEETSDHLTWTSPKPPHSGFKFSSPTTKTRTRRCIRGRTKKKRRRTKTSPAGMLRRLWSSKTMMWSRRAWRARRAQRAQMRSRSKLKN